MNRPQAALDGVAELQQLRQLAEGLHGLRTGLERFAERVASRCVTCFAEPAADDEDDPQEQAELIADILYGLYGEAALGLLEAGNEEAEKGPASDDEAGGGGVVQYAEGMWRFAEWNPLHHPRGANGRFIARGSPEAVATAKEAIGKVMKGDTSGPHAEKLMEHLHILTVKQLRQLHKEHGQKAPGRLRQQLVDGVKARLEAGKAGAEKPAEGPAVAKPGAAEKPAGSVAGTKPGPQIEKIDHGSPSWDRGQFTYKVGDKEFISKKDATEHVQKLKAEEAKRGEEEKVRQEKEAKDKVRDEQIARRTDWSMKVHENYASDLQAAAKKAGLNVKVRPKGLSYKVTGPDADSPELPAVVKPLTESYQAHINKHFKGGIDDQTPTRPAGEEQAGKPGAAPEPAPVPAAPAPAPGTPAAKPAATPAAVPVTRLAPAESPGAATEPGLAAQRKAHQERQRKATSEIRRLAKIGLEGGHVTPLTLTQMLDAGMSAQRMQDYAKLQNKHLGDQSPTAKRR